MSAVPSWHLKPTEPKPIYVDYNATTPVSSEVAASMQPFLTGATSFGNPSSSHGFGMIGKDAMISARKHVANFLGCQSNEVFFTSGATESINWALKGAMLANILPITKTYTPGQWRGNHMIISATEHVILGDVVAYLAHNYGCSWSVVPVDANGQVSVSALKAAITDETAIISIMLANNETGSINSIAALAAVVKEVNACRAKKIGNSSTAILFHTDASQAAGKIEVNVDKLGVDMLTLAGHKMYAPKGVGVLYVRSSLARPLQSLFHGGSQEAGLRAGTENVLLCVGMGEACQQAGITWQKQGAHMLECRDRLWTALQKIIPAQYADNMRVNGHPTERLPNTLSLAFKNINSALLLSQLTNKIAASTGSACHSAAAGKVATSAVLKAMKVPFEFAVGTIRISVGQYSTLEEMDSLAAILMQAVTQMWTDIKEGKLAPPTQAQASGGVHSSPSSAGSSPCIGPRGLKPAPVMISSKLAAGGGEGGIGGEGIAIAGRGFSAGLTVNAELAQSKSRGLASPSIPAKLQSQLAFPSNGGSDGSSHNSNHSMEPMSPVREEDGSKKFAKLLAPLMISRGENEGSGEMRQQSVLMSPSVSSAMAKSISLQKALVHGCPFDEAFEKSLLSPIKGDSE